MFILNFKEAECYEKINYINFYVLNGIIMLIFNKKLY